MVSNDLHIVAERAPLLPQVTTLTNFDGLDREQPALLKDFVAAEYTDTHRRVSNCAILIIVCSVCTSHHCIILRDSLFFSICFGSS